MIEQILPPSAVAEECFGDDPSADLMPSEETTVDLGAGRTGRRNEFATARGCARRALVRLGVPATSVPVHPLGGPWWPAGVAGSITHCRGYRAAAVAREGDLRGLGIDAEPHDRLPAVVRARIALPEEEEQLLALERFDVHYDRVLFCIKESLFKAWHPLTRRYLRFREASVRIRPRSSTFVARLLQPAAGPASLSTLAGRFTVDSGLILAVTAVGRIDEYGGTR